uniref:Uncharacterized protein n=1 Tax=Terrapene triunguis TaxID=2587831 RepID=A0A674IRD3_9SAUR
VSRMKTKNHRGRYYFHFTDGKTETQSSAVTCSRSQNETVQEPRVNLGIYLLPLLGNEGLFPTLYFITISLIPNREGQLPHHLKF